MGELRTGDVLEFSNEEGFGFIRGDDGVTYFVPFFNIEMEGYKTLKGSRRVEFEVAPDAVGDAHPDSGDDYAQVAVRVRPIPE